MPWLSHFECQYFAKWIGNRYWALGLSFIWLGPVHAHSSGVKQAQVFELVFFCLRFILCSITSKYLDQPTAPFNLQQPRFFSNKWTLLYFEIVTTHWVVISNDIRTPQKIVTVILRVPTPPKRNVMFKFVLGLWKGNFVNQRYQLRNIYMVFFIRVKISSLGISENMKLTSM